jgi:hypothetical protein
VNPNTGQPSGVPSDRGWALSSGSGLGRWRHGSQMTAHLLGDLLRLPARLLALRAQLLGNAVAAVGALCRGDVVPQQSGDDAAAVGALGCGDAVLEQLPVANGCQHLHEDTSVRRSAGLHLVLSGSSARCQRGLRHQVTHALCTASRPALQPVVHAAREGSQGRHRSIPSMHRGAAESMPSCGAHPWGSNCRWLRDTACREGGKPVSAVGHGGTFRRHLKH